MTKRRVCMPNHPPASPQQAIRGTDDEMPYPVLALILDAIR